MCHIHKLLYLINLKLFICLFVYFFCGCIIYIATQILWSYYVMDLLSSFVSMKITFLLVYWSLWNLNTMITKWHKIKVGFDLFYCRPYRFCGRILLWILSNSVCRHKGFCAITFLLVDWSICNLRQWPLAQNIVFYAPATKSRGGGY